MSMTPIERALAIMAIGMLGLAIIAVLGGI